MFAILLDELYEVLDATASAVGDWVLLVTSLVELDSRETLNLIGNIIQGRIDLGDGNLIGETSVIVQLGEDVVLWRKRLAVTAPWCVEFNQDIFLIVQDNIIVVLGDDNLNWPFLCLWDWLRLDAGLNLAVDELLDEFANSIGCDLCFLVIWELLVVDSILDGESREL